MAKAQQNPEQVAWSVKRWCAAVDISPAYFYELLAAGRVKAVRLGGKRLVVTPPAAFLASLADAA
jgi:hypothetical protein